MTGYGTQIGLFTLAFSLLLYPGCKPVHHGELVSASYIWLPNSLICQRALISVEFPFDGQTDRLIRNGLTIVLSGRFCLHRWANH